jgi:3-phosphoshikimate 1-carboxyvinyltransferase
MPEDVYNVKCLGENPNIRVHVPGSKSISNRALCLAALCGEKTTLHGTIISQDSRVFMDALRGLGYSLKLDEKSGDITISGKLNPTGEVYVGSAGTAARFLTAVLALSGGSYHVTSSMQMEKRPMKPLLEALECLGSHITYEKEKYHFPFTIEGFSDTSVSKVPLNIDESSQFLSAIMMAGVLLNRKFTVCLTGKRDARSYVRITERMIHDFGGEMKQIGKDEYLINGEAKYSARQYQIEPDMSAACYFYAMAALTGGKTLVYHVHRDSVQGDIQFLFLLEKMGCSLIETPQGLLLQGPRNGILSGVTVDMSDFSDQTMTLAAMAPFLMGTTIIYNVAHIRIQESDRLHAIATELNHLGITCEEKPDGLIITPGTIHPGAISTYDDHRMAMAFSLIGCMVPGIQIRNPGCCAKTFENYFQILDSITGVDKS